MNKKKQLGKKLGTLYKRNWNSIVSDEEKRVVENSKDGLVLTITIKSESDGSDIEIYRGNFDVDMNRRQLSNESFCLISCSNECARGSGYF